MDYMVLFETGDGKKRARTHTARMGWEAGEN